jgi:hypothetical protein
MADAYVGQDWDDIDPGETILFSLDFGKLISAGDSIGSATWTCSVASGVDAAAASRRSGTTMVSGTVVSQLMTTMQPGVLYRLQAYATLASGQVVTLYSHVACTPAS